MQRRRMGALILCGFLTFATSGIAQGQGIRGMIKKKVLDKAGQDKKKADDPAEKGIVFDDRVRELTKPVVQRYLHGLETELPLLEEFDRTLEAYYATYDKNAAGYEECRTKVAMSPQAQAVAMQLANLPANATQADVQRVSEKMSADMNALLKKTCGDNLGDEWPDQTRRDKVQEIHRQGAAAAGMLLTSASPESRGGPSIDQWAEELPFQPGKTDPYDIAFHRIKGYCAYKKNAAPGMFPLAPGTNLAFPASKLNPNVNGTIYYTAAEVDAIDYQCDGPVMMVTGKIEVIMDAIYIRGRGSKKTKD